MHDHRAAQGRRRGSPARSATGGRPAGSSRSRRARGGAGHRRHRQVVQGDLELAGSTPATGTRWRCGPGATLINMEFVQFHPTGMVWPPSVKGILVTESVRGDGGVLKNSEGKRFMFDYIPDVFKDAVRRRPRRRPTAGTTTRTTTAARRSCCPATRSPGRSTPRSRPAAAPRTAACSSTSPSRLPAEEIQRRLPSMYHQFKELADVDITAEPMEVGPTCHYVMGGVEVDPDTAAVHGARAVRGRRGAPAACTAPTGSAATRCPTCWCSAAGPGVGAAEYVDALGRRAPGGRRGRRRRRAGGGAGAVRAAQGGENPYTRPRRTCSRR